MSYLLDTNVLSELRRPEKADAKVLAWAAATPMSAMFLSAITMLEIELGTLLMERKDADRGRQLRLWIEERIVRHFAGRVLSVDLPVAVTCARLHVPVRRPERDCLIAATALVHAMTVVTRNVADFAPTGVKILNPWE